MGIEEVEGTQSGLRPLVMTLKWWGSTLGSNPAHLTVLAALSGDASLSYKNFEYAFTPSLISLNCILNKNQWHGLGVT